MIYLVTKWYSDWDGSSTHIIRAYEKRSEAIKYVKKGNRVFKKLQRFYGAKNKQYDKLMNRAMVHDINLAHFVSKYYQYDGWNFQLVKIDLISKNGKN